MGRLVRPTVGVETRWVVQRRGEVAFLNDRTLGRLSSQGSADDIAVPHRARIRFVSPEVTGAVSPEFHDAPEKPIPRVAASSSTKGLKRTNRSLTDLLFSSRQKSPIRHQPSPSGSLVWDDFLHSTPLDAAAASPDSSNDDDSAAPWSPFEPALRPDLRRIASPSPVRVARRISATRAARLQRLERHYSRRRQCQPSVACSGR